MFWRSELASMDPDIDGTFRGKPRNQARPRGVQNGTREFAELLTVFDFKTHPD